MYVNRMQFGRLKPLRGAIPVGGGDLPEPARRRLLFQGANGSGKTTLLETIFTLWRFFGDWLDEGAGSEPPHDHRWHYLAHTDLVAMEIAGVPDTGPLWIGVAGNSDAWKALCAEHPEATFAAVVRNRQGYWTVHLPPDDLLTLRHRSLAGSESFPNVVYFPPEGRTIRAHSKKRGEIIDTTRFNWSALYDSEVSLDSVLLTVKALSPERFDSCLRLVNLALTHRQKQITGFGPKGRLVVEGKTPEGEDYQHPIEDLSSGERQILLLVGFVAAFLRPGGILLIDEPDLHLHIAMVTQLMETLELIVRERNGQLIVASHSERVWDWFARDEERILLSPWQGDPV